MNNNPLRRNAIISLFVAFVSAAMIFTPAIIGIDGMAGGFAISFISFFIAIAAVTFFGLYFNHSCKLDALMRGNNVLAHWVYPPSYWRTYAQKEYLTEKAEKKFLFIIIAGFALFFGFLFWIFDFEAGFYVFLVMLGLIGLIAFTWRFSAWHNYRQNMNGVREAYITKDSVYMNRKFYSWHAAFTSLDKVTLQNNCGLNLLTFKYTSKNLKTGPQVYLLRVPVPPGEEETAKKILQVINPHH